MPRLKYGTKSKYDALRVAVRTTSYSMNFVSRGNKSRTENHSNQVTQKDSLQTDLQKALIKHQKKQNRMKSATLAARRQFQTINHNREMQRRNQQNRSSNAKSSAYPQSNEAGKSKRVLSLTLQNSNVNFKDMKIQDVMKQQKHILDQNEDVMVSTRKQLLETLSEKELLSRERAHQLQGSDTLSMTVDTEKPPKIIQGRNTESKVILSTTPHKRNGAMQASGSENLQTQFNQMEDCEGTDIPTNKSFVSKGQEEM